MKLKDLSNVSTNSNISLTIEFYECDFERLDILTNKQKERMIRQYGEAEVKTINACGRSIDITATLKTQEE